MNRYFITHPEIFDLMHDAVIATDLEGKVMECNRAAQQIYGYRRHELVGSSVAILYPEAQRMRMNDLLREVSARGKANGEFLNVTKNGDEIWIHLSVSLLTDDHGQPYGMVGFSIDISRTKEEERKRAQAEAKHRLACEAAGVGTWHAEFRDGDWVLDWDKQSERLLHLPAGSKPSMKLFLDTMHPDDRWQVEDALSRRLPADQEYRAEYRVKDSHGATHYVLGAGRMLYEADGQLQCFLGVGLDVTGQKRAEEEVRRLHGKYRAILESPFIGVAAGTLEGFTDVNDGFCNIVGYSREELLSGEPTWQKLTPPEFLRQDYGALQQLIERGIAAPIEKEYIRSDGKRVRVILGAALMSREPLEWSCFILDVTEHHQALEALRARDMTAAAARLGHLLAHEINNPLASLTNILYLIQHGSQQSSVDLMSAAQTALERITRITRQMIGIYGDKERASKFQVSSVLEDTLAAIETRARAKNLRVLRHNGFGEASFTGIESDLRRVLASLLENAVEHVQPGGTIRVSLRPSQDWRTRDFPGLRMTIADNGPGIPHQQMRTLFEPFSSTKEMRGAGLGLWMCRSIAERHGGTVRVRSTVRKGASGTAVGVFLPGLDAKAFTTTALEPLVKHSL